LLAGNGNIGRIDPTNVVNVISDIGTGRRLKRLLLTEETSAVSTRLLALTSSMKIPIHAEMLLL
jgi:hypothetical protein